MARRRTILRQGASLATFAFGTPLVRIRNETPDSESTVTRCPTRASNTGPAGQSTGTNDENPVGFPDQVGDTLGYYFPSGMEPAEAPVKELSDICFHALDIDDAGRPVSHHEDEMASIAARAADAGTTPHLQVGGMEVDFEPAVAHAEDFANATVGIMEEFGYRGLAIDWEYPDDGSEFAHLMGAVRDALDERGDYILGTAVSAIPSIAESVYAMEEVGALCEYVLVMSYDFSGPWSERTGHNAPLYSTSTEPLSVESAIEYWRGDALEDEQLLAGIPFYGYSFSAVSDENGGYDRPFEQGTGHPSPDIQDLLDDDDFESHFDEAAAVPFGYSAEDETFLTFESPRSVEAKAEYARNLIGGVGMWAINQDPQGRLTEAITSR